MKKAFISSPYAGDIKRNKQYARELTRAAIKSGYTPITPHLYITEAINDNDNTEREQGLALSLDLLASCDILMIGCDYGISSGMQKEIAQAVADGIPIYSLAYAIETVDGFMCKVVKATIINNGNAAYNASVGSKTARIISTMPKGDK